jgi:hypothetical protein
MAEGLNSLLVACELIIVSVLLGLRTIKDSEPHALGIKGHVVIRIDTDLACVEQKSRPVHALEVSPWPQQ